MGGVRWEGQGEPRFDKSFDLDEQRRLWFGMQGDDREKRLAMAWARTGDDRWYQMQLAQLLAETLRAAPALAAVALVAVAVRPETQAMVYRALREQPRWDRYFSQEG